MFTGTQLFGSAPRPRLNEASQLDGETATFLTKASLALDPLTTGNMDTVLEATTAGTAGNLLTIELVHSAGAPNGGTLTRVGTAFTFTYKGGTTTVANFETAVTALAGTDDLIAVKTGGTGADILSATLDLLSPTAFAGGLDQVDLNRKFEPSKNAGHWSVHTIVTGTGTGTIKFYYSNLPYPRLDTLTDWVNDASKDVTLAGSTVSTFTTGVDKVAEHMLASVVTTAGTVSVVGWATAGKY